MSAFSDLEDLRHKLCTSSCPNCENIGRKITQEIDAYILVARCLICRSVERVRYDGAVLLKWRDPDFYTEVDI